ncbi:MAG: GGDEF domain-containing protein [Lachnospiraceae bacterium]|jgi:diguanylate cyclase (GGDEF)-like protein|nr:GGDEF domain-containing protein [Lachnospiraceae bacterium]MCI1727392.1 GGDEF domain-containing protein [Lachnospiraceae bacterium]
MTVFIYIELNLFCILILAYILYELKANGGEQMSMLAFRRVVVAVLTALAVDCLWELLNGFPGLPARIAEYAVNIIAATQYAFICWIFNFFVITRTGGMDFSLKNFRRHGILFSSPILIQFLIAFLSVWTGWFFRLDENNRYVPGSLYFLQLVIPVFYLIGAAVKLKRAIWLSDNRQSAEGYYTLLSFVIFPLAGGILTCFINDAPFVWPMCVISLLIVFASMQKMQVSTDGLTGMNNRAKFDSYLASVTEEKIAPMRLYLFLMDVNSFKSINDQYGHYEGDQALRETSSLLKKVGQDYDVFLARYGGDEFAIVAKLPNPLLVENIREQIRKGFREANAASKRPYEVSVSIGVAEYPKDGSMPVSELIAAADRKLYEDKKAYKAESGR